MASEDGRVAGPLRPTPRHALWRWATPQAEAALDSRDLGVILRFYRAIHGLSQTQLGELIGYDKTYVSLFELGKRRLDDLESRRRVAECLQIPPHILGVTDQADTDHRAMLQFGESAVRLAEIARQSGHASESVAELWPLVARLEARAADGHTEREALRLLARARVGLGVALGNVLPEERLHTAARWTAKGLDIARHFDDAAFASYVLRMHGNELRKANLRGAAVDRLRHAEALARSSAARAAVLPLLARAAGELGDIGLFDSVMRETDTLLDQAEHTSLFNPFALYEIRLRGLIATGRPDIAISLVEASPLPATSAAPQWRVIEAITVGHVQLLAGDHAGAAQSLGTAIQESARQRLPHQLQRIIRSAGRRLPDVRGEAEQALEQIREEMAA